jgi:replicative DNA helicase
MDLELSILSLLVDKHTMKTAWNLGLRADFFEKPLHKSVLELIQDYWLKSKMESVPTPDVLLFEFPSLVLSAPAEVDETLEWLIAKLKERFLKNQVQDSLLAVAQLAGANETMQSIKVMREAAWQMTHLMSPRAGSSDVSQNVEERRERYAQKATFTGIVRGAPLGLSRVDEHTFGLLPGELAVMVGYAKTGKAVRNDSPILTPTGWKKMGDLKIGDDVVDPYGHSSQVTAIYPQGKIPVYRIDFSDGSSTDASGDHLWSVVQGTTVRIPGNQRREQVWTTDKFREKLEKGQRVPYLVDPVGLATYDFPHENIPLDPYFLGLLLGDGGLTHSPMTITTPEPEIIEYCARVASSLGVQFKERDIVGSCYTFSFPKKPQNKEKNPLTKILTDLSLVKTHSWNKFIPDCYKWASAATRLAVLQGLMDAEGSQARGSAEYSSASRQLRDDVVWLARSLGLIARTGEKETSFTSQGEKKSGRTAYRAFIQETEKVRVFRLPRKLGPVGTKPRGRKPIAVTYVGDVECQCITVSAPSHLYLLNDFIPTHNSWSLVNSFVRAREAGYTPFLCTMELPVADMEERLDAVISGVSHHQLQRGNLMTADITKLKEAQEEFAALGAAYIEKPPRDERSVIYIVNKAREMGANLLLIDQLSFMQPRHYHTDEKDKIKEIMSDLKIEISENEVSMMPVILAAQFNRQMMDKATGKPGMQHIGLSSSIEQIVDIAYGLRQTREMRANKSMMLDIMGFRRGNPMSYLLEWELSTERTRFGVREVIDD